VKSGTKVFVKQDYHTPIGMNCAKTMQVSYIFTALEINILYINVRIQYTHTHSTVPYVR